MPITLIQSKMSWLNRQKNNDCIPNIFISKKVYRCKHKKLSIFTMRHKAPFSLYTYHSHGSVYNNEQNSRPKMSETSLSIQYFTSADKHYIWVSLSLIWSTCIHQSFYFPDAGLSKQKQTASVV